MDNQVPLDVDAYSGQCSSANSFREARALLRQYLQVYIHSIVILVVTSSIVLLARVIALPSLRYYSIVDVLMINSCEYVSLEYALRSVYFPAFTRWEGKRLRM